MKLAAVKAKSFRNQAAFHAWLRKNGGSASDLFVRCYKVQYAARGLTYREALDEALCFGWIDGVRYGLDEVSFATRFTRRKIGSAWSTINIKRIAELQAGGRMQPPGYRRIAADWVMCAKQEATREKRFGVLLACSSAGEPVPPLRRT
jgi:uncharacterized protein YdeI (YjbR/CyaY-like superfamily)